MNGLVPEQIRLVWTLLCSTLLAIVAPTGTFLAALTLACMFNVWAGMRADGVSGCYKMIMNKRYPHNN